MPFTDSLGLAKETKPSGFTDSLGLVPVEPKKPSFTDSLGIMVEKGLSAMGQSQLAVNQPSPTVTTEEEPLPQEWYAAQRKRRLGQVGEVFRSAGKGLVDVGAQAITAPITYPMISLAELGGLISGGPTEAKRRGEIASKMLVPQPTEPVSKEITEVVGKGIEGVTYPLRKYGKYLFGKAGEIVDTITGDKFDPAVLKELDKGKKSGEWVGEKAGELATFVGASVVPKIIKGSNWYREMTIPERDLVIMSYQDMKQAGMTEGQILRNLSNKEQRAQMVAEAIDKRRNIPSEAPAPEPPVQPKPKGPISPVAKPIVPMGLLPEPSAPRIVPQGPTILPSGPTIEMGAPAPEAVPGEATPLVPRIIPHEGAGLHIEYLRDGEVVGTGQLLGSDIPNVTVKEPYRRQGIGEEIMQDLISRGGEKGYIGTEAGKGLMEKVGWEDIGGGQYGIKPTETLAELEEGEAPAPLDTPAEVVEGKVSQEATKQPKEQTFIGWIKDRGGISDVSLKGEIKQLGTKEEGIIGLTNKKTGQAIDQLTVDATADGWLPEGSTTTDFLKLLNKDVKALKEGKAELRATPYSSDKNVQFANKAIKKGDKALGDEVTEMQKQGYSPIKDNVSVGNIEKGDKVLIQGEEFTHKGFDKDGNAIIEDGTTYVLDPFDQLPVDGIKRVTPIEQSILQSQPDQAPAPEPTGEAEAKLSQKVGEAIGDKVIPAGLSIEQVGKTPLINLPGKFSFTDPDIEARFTKSKGVQKEPLSARARLWLSTLKNKATREYENLPRTGQFAPLRMDLLTLAKQKGVASDRTIRNLQGITINLTKSEYDLFTRKVILDDLKTVAAEDQALPFGFTKESLALESERVDSFLNENVKSSTEDRNTLWASIRNDYVQSLKDIGFDVSDRVTNPDYYRHQILDYARIKSLTGTGAKIKTPASRGFLRERKGSELDINTDYLQAEHEVMAQMLYDIEIAKVIKNVDTTYNKSAELKQKAKQKNYVNVVGGPENVKRLDELRGQKAEILASDDNPDAGERALLKEINKEIWELDPTMPFKAKMAQGFKQLEKDGFLPEVDEEYVVNEEFNFSDIVKLGDEGNVSALMILKAIAEKEAFMKEALGKDYMQWKNGLDDRMVPDSHIKWQPREGNTFYFSDTIPSKMAEQLWAGTLEELGITKEDLAKKLTLGGRRKEFIIPNEVAITLDNLSPPESINIFSKLNKEILRGWKQLALISPRRLFKYNIRNLTGDAEAAVIGNSRSFAYSPRAFRELVDTVVLDKPMTSDMKDWFERGGMESTLQALEMGEIDKLKMFNHLVESRGKITELPLKVWQGYWKAARISTDIREAVLRYANYLSYLEQMEKNPMGKPNNFGASDRKEVMALGDIKDRAFWLSNDLLGAYDKVSVMGQDLSTHLYPFFRFQEVNFKRYNQFMRNAIEDGEFAIFIGKKLAGTGIKSPLLLLKLGKFAALASALWAATQVWNLLMFPDEEKDLPKEEQKRPHVIFGRDEQGKVNYFSRIGILGDYLGWLGLDVAPNNMKDYIEGKKTIKEIALDIVKSPINKFASGVSPILKVPGELISHRTTFPDITKPGTIRDQGLAIARQLSLENEYIAITGKPSPGYRKSLSNVFIYKADPGQTAYQYILEEKDRFLKNIGKGSIGFWLTPKGDALYNLKLAVRYKDKEAEGKYLSEYLRYAALQGQTVQEAIQGLTQSLKSMHPLSGLQQEEQIQFQKKMNETDKYKLQQAMKFYTNVLLPKAESNPIGGPQ